MKCENLKLQRSAHVCPFFSQCMFAHSLRKFSMRDWGIEQKWMSILLPLLLLYNGNLPCQMSFTLELRLKQSFSRVAHEWHYIWVKAFRFTARFHVPSIVSSCLRRSIFSTVIPREQLVSWNIGCFLSSSFPECSAALLALRLSRHQGSGGFTALTPLYFKLNPIFHVLCCIICCLSSPPGWEEMSDILLA